MEYISYRFQGVEYHKFPLLGSCLFNFFGRSQSISFIILFVINRASDQTKILDVGGAQFYELNLLRRNMMSCLSKLLLKISFHVNTYEI